DSLDAAKLTTGELPDARLVGTYASTLHFSNSANTYAGSFTGTFGGSPILDQYLASAETWNSKVSSISVTAPLTVSGTTNPIVSLPQASSSSNGYLAASDFNKFISSANANAGTVFRWAVFQTYDGGAWMADNDSSLFGGVSPSSWTDGNYTAVNMSGDPELFRTIFINTAHAGKNALVYSDVSPYYSSTNGKIIL
ncbi:MAG: hypothetical protein J0653_08405, partial [Deltaproteobacteria bacterium]|nr:hypothetical protein [Deltaproteobacteria bacterium]